MAALGNTDISTSTVASALGSSTHDVASLFIDTNLNAWGFNSPLSVEQIRCWGKRPSGAPYSLGSFRGYDQNWRCFGVLSANPSPELAVYSIGSVDYQMGFFPVWSAASTGNSHTFDAFFSRSSPSFTNPTTYTQFLTGFTISDDGDRVIYINPQTPPDGGTALTPNSYVYIKIKHKTSPARRWFDDGYVLSDASPSFYIDPNDTDARIAKIWIGSDPYPRTITFGSGANKIVTKYAGGNGMQFDINFSNGWPNTMNITSIIVNINNQSNFAGSISDTGSWSGTLTLPAATYTGGVVTYGTLSYPFLSMQSMTKWTVGQAFYGRVSTDGGATWQAGFNGTVVNTQIII